MNPHLAHELATMHQRDLVAEADHARMAREVRLASRRPRATRHWSMTAILHAAAAFSARVVTHRGHAHSH